MKNWWPLSRSQFAAGAWLGLWFLAWAVPLAAADPATLQLPGELGAGGFGDNGFGAKVEFSATLEARNGGPAGKLSLTAKVQKDWHIYSVTQKGGPGATRLELKSDPAIQPVGPFTPDKAPTIHYYEDTWPGLKVEEHEGTVTWQTGVTLPAGVDPATFELKLQVRGQACSGTVACVAFNQAVPVRLVGFAAGPVSGTPASDASPSKVAPPAAAEVPFTPGPYHGRQTHARWTGRVRWTSSSQYQLEVTAELDDKWHTYAWAAQPPGKEVLGNKPTLLAVTAPDGWRLGPAHSDDKRVTHDASGEEKQEYYEQRVTWTAPLEQAAASRGGELRGFIGFQTCANTGCDTPAGAEFSVVLPDPSQNPAGELALQFRPASYSKAAAAVRGEPTKSPTESPAAVATKPAGPTRQWKVRELSGSTQLTLWSALGLAFVGGFLLNFMPCVLPVIGLKLVAFIQQSQGSRRQAVLLNLYYSLGILAVFMVLASMAAAPHWFGRQEKLGWGEQFQSSTFNMVMASLVFVFALSLLGVWELSVPAFLGTGKAAGLANQSGYVGAFSKGIFTTLLATPCVGPFMGAALTWAFSQTPLVIYATFVALALGMSLPYLIIGAFPQLMRFLPKPGAWMDTFKQIMGFVLLATVVFIFSFLRKELIVPTFGILVGLWLGCWWIGRTPVYAEWQSKAKSWVIGTAFAGMVGWLSFAMFGPTTTLLPWQKFSRHEFESLLNQGQTVMVDFTADWCLVCKTNERLALNTSKTLSAVEQNAVTVIRADKSSDEDPATEEINQLLVDLGHVDGSIPYLVIFPGNGAAPIAFSGPVTQSTVLAAIREAGPSRSTGPTVAQVP